MSEGLQNRLALFAAASVAILFGALTILSGGYVLFGGDAASQAAGNAVQFVLWYNFLAGFAYVLAGIGLLARARWAYWLSSAILTGTGIVFSAFILHVLLGGAYETRTFLALSLRTIVWVVIALIARKVTSNKAALPQKNREQRY